MNPVRLDETVSSWTVGLRHPNEVLTAKWEAHLSFIRMGCSQIVLCTTGFVLTEGPDVPYCGVQVAPDTADQTVNANNRQHPLDNPEARTKRNKT